MVEECKETRIHGLWGCQLYVEWVVKGWVVVPFGMESDALRPRRLGLELMSALAFD